MHFKYIAHFKEIYQKVYFLNILTKIVAFLIYVKKIYFKYM